MLFPLTTVPRNQRRVSMSTPTTFNTVITLGCCFQDSESKKCEKKESSGPPLQTASMSVRALIEEKIIQKRITNPQLTTTTMNTQLSFTSKGDVASSKKLSRFAV